MERSIKKGWTDFKKSELLVLPYRNDAPTVYDSLLLVPSRLKHDSGYMRIAVIGVREGVPVEIAAMPDDLNLYANQYHEFIASVRMDCSYPSGVLHLWDRNSQFQVGSSYSSTDIKVVPHPQP